MRCRGFLDDDEFLHEKASLIQQKHHLEEKLKKTDTKNINLCPIFKKTLEFSQNVTKWYKSANPEQKRLIIETVGSNLNY